jgi:AcrR family transcriptional regulator
MTETTARTSTRSGRSGNTARDRLLDTAAELFYTHGVHVGIDTVCQAARVSKRSMYQLFGNKDDLIAASLRERTAPAYRESLLSNGDDDSPRGRILAVFERMEDLEGTHHFRGCPFVAAAIEVKEPDHPASVVAREEKNMMSEFFRNQGERGGAADPGLLARQLMLIFDGASARSVIQARCLDNLAVETARVLLDVAGLEPSRTT